jgi:hypothetical protein
LRAGQRPDLGGALGIGFSMDAAQVIDAFLADLALHLAQKHIGKKSARHADAAVNAPHRQLDAFGQQGIMPGEHVIIDTVDKRAVEIE